VLLSNTLIGLREGLEAGLVVTIVVAFLVRSGRRESLALVRKAIFAALAASVAAGAVLTFTAANLSPWANELFEATTSFVAVALITGMIFWMRHPVADLEARLQGELSVAMRMGPLALFMVIFTAVLREGLEAAIFVLVAAQGAGTGTLRPLLSFAVGVAVAVALTWLIYQGVVRINLAKFFAVTGFLLVLVAAGIMGHGARDLQEANVLPGGHTYAFDISSVISVETWHGSLLKGIFNFSPQPTVLEVLAWAGYGAIVMVLFIRALRRPARAVRQSTDRQAESVI
jgi:high-affinity iron transporter